MRTGTIAWTSAHHRRHLVVSRTTSLLADIDKRRQQASSSRASASWRTTAAIPTNVRQAQCVYYYTLHAWRKSRLPQACRSATTRASAPDSTSLPVDIDKDGDLDLVTTGKWGGPVIFENKLIGSGAH
jgi:hypothetical protein